MSQLVACRTDPESVLRLLQTGLILPYAVESNNCASGAKPTHGRARENSGVTPKVGGIAWASARLAKSWRALSLCGVLTLKEDKKWSDIESWCLHSC